MKNKRRKQLEQYAEDLKKRATKEERLFFAYLEAIGEPFKFQHVCDQFILDFYFPHKRLAVEIDGPNHKSQRKYDKKRTKILKSRNIAVLRFTNERVISDLAGCIKEYREVLCLTLIRKPQKKRPKRKKSQLALWYKENRKKLKEYKHGSCV